MTCLPALEMQDLDFTYPDGTAAIGELNLRIGRGERLALIGPNGAGKSTLIALACGLLSPRSGVVRIFGEPMSARNRAVLRRRIGLVSQNPDDQLFLTSVYDDVAFGPLNQKLPREEVDARVRESLDAVDAGGLANRFSGHLSFGQKRSVAIACVLAMRPDFLILDEPASNLDPHGRRVLIGQIQALARASHDEARTLLLVTHDLEMALECCARAALLSNGKIVAEGPCAQIMGDRALMEAHRLEVPRSLL